MSYLCRADQLVFYGAKAAAGADNSFPEPLGFIGANYQRKSCHWGDFKIPESGNLDFSVSDFEVDKNYVSNGWQTYMSALAGSGDSAKTRPARAEEKRLGWK